MLHERTMSLGQRLRSQSALKVRAFQNRVRFITQSCIVGFEKKCLAEMFITSSRQDNMSYARSLSLGQRSRSQSAFVVCA